MPFPNAKGYHSKTIAYSLRHIFRIEDIVAHLLIADDEQVFFRGRLSKENPCTDYYNRKELVKEEIEEFSKQLNVYHKFKNSQRIPQDFRFLNSL